MSGITLGINISALKARRHLEDGSNQLSQSFQRLSSGLRINKASDDAAGLAIATKLNSDSRVFGQAIRNANDTISFFNIADAALGELSNILSRQKELAQQAANGAYTVTQRRALQDESEALVDEFNRIVQSVKFNQKAILDGSMSQLTAQLGYGENGSITFSVAQELDRAIGDGTFGTAVSYTTGLGPRDLLAADLNGDGFLDLVATNRNATTATIRFGTSQGDYSTVTTLAIGFNPSGVTTEDLDNDGDQDLVFVGQNGGANTLGQAYINNGTGTFVGAGSFSTGGVTEYTEITSGDYNDDGFADIAYTQSGNLWVAMGNGNGTFKAPTSLGGAAAGSGVSTMESFDVNHDGNLDLLTSTGGRLMITLGNGDGTFRSPTSFVVTSATSLAIGDFDFDGNIDAVVAGGTFVSVLKGNGDGSFQAAVNYTALNSVQNTQIADMDGDGLLDIVSISSGNNVATIFYNNGEGSFSAGTTTSFTFINKIVVGDFNADGVNDIAGLSTVGNALAIMLQDTTQSTSMPYLNITTQQDAQSSISIVDAVQNRVNAERGVVGGALSRLDVAVNNLEVSRSNYIDAASRILDADIAAEVANMVRLQVLQQAAAAVMAQANQSYSMVSMLLDGL